MRWNNFNFINIEVANFNKVKGLKHNGIIIQLTEYRIYLTINQKLNFISI